MQYYWMQEKQFVDIGKQTVNKYHGLSSPYYSVSFILWFKQSYHNWHISYGPHEIIIKFY